MAGKIKRVFAIRDSHYVEVRVASSPPKKLVSKLTKTTIRVTKTIVYIPHDPWHKMIEESKPVKIIMKQTSFIGGRVIGGCSWRLFQIYSKKHGLPSLSPDSMIEFPGELAQTVLKKKGQL